MDNFYQYLVILINLIIGIRYTTLTIRKKINPSLAMWVFFSIAVTGSLFSYLLEGNFSPWDNILNTSDIVLCGTVTLTIIFFGGTSSRFNKFDLICLGAVLIILLFWAFSKAHYVTNLSLQVIQAIAYLPVIKRMWDGKENTESFFPWILLLLVSIVSLFSAGGSLAIIYSLRATACVLTLLILMIRIEVKNKKRLVSNQP